MPHRLESIVHSYVSEHLPQLYSTYHWKFDLDKVGHLVPQIEGKSWAEKNLSLKHQLHQLWLSSEHSQRVNIADYFVRTWGGIRAVRPETIERYVIELSQKQCPQLQGIPSWSKIAAIVEPQKNFIFDARVVMSLNALQLIELDNIEVLLPLLQSRNTVVSRVDKLIRGQLHTKRAARVGREHNFYEQYRHLLLNATASFKDPWAAAKAEMVLFANAETLALAAEEKLLS
ncbi:MAG: hypothetical protein ACTJH7_11325 [Alcaligenes sp.]